jgi:hypothetical protein
MKEASKYFFFEKTKQKTFDCLERNQTIESFLLLFFKKEQSSLLAFS